MPLTNTLDAAQATQQDFKSFMRDPLAALEGRLETKFSGTDVKFAGLEVKIAELRVEMHGSQRDLAFQLIAALAAVTSLAVAIIKLFPNAH